MPKLKFQRRRTRKTELFNSSKKILLMSLSSNVIYYELLVKTCLVYDFALLFYAQKLLLEREQQSCFKLGLLRRMNYHVHIYFKCK